MDEAVPFWHSRGYLPHFETREKMQSITFRLADSLPQSKLRELEADLVRLPKDRLAIERRKRIEHYLDEGMGCCALRNPAVAGVVQETLLRFDSERYRLLAWCIMPNHVHVLIWPLADLVLKFKMDKTNDSKRVQMDRMQILGIRENIMRIRS